jgi:hypothetical protein
MRKSHGIPSLEEARQLMQEAERRNPGPWFQHSAFVAQAAELIAAQLSSLDPSTAYILGYIHDIGRREGVTDLRHTLDGFYFLSEKGFPDAARICLTHSFPLKNAFAGSGKWDCSSDEIKFVQDFLDRIEYTQYDKLIQLCDALALPTGFCLIEKRLMDVALRHGVNELSVEKWKAFIHIREDFEALLGKSIYTLLPGVVSNTFGFNIADEPSTTFQ